MDTKAALAQIARLERGVADAQTQKDRLEGAIDTIKKQLKEKYNVNTLEEAVLLLEQATDSIRIEEQRIANMMERLSQQYGWNF